MRRSGATTTLITAALFITAAFAGSGPAFAAASFPAPQSGKCLDDTGWSTTPGTQLQIWSCSGNANQHWALP